MHLGRRGQKSIKVRAKISIYTCWRRSKEGGMGRLVSILRLRLRLHDEPFSSSSHLVLPSSYSGIHLQRYPPGFGLLALPRMVRPTAANHSCQVSISLFSLHTTYTHRPQTIGLTFRTRESEKRPQSKRMLLIIQPVCSPNTNALSARTLWSCGSRSKRLSSRRPVTTRMQWMAILGGECT